MLLVTASMTAWMHPGERIDYGCCSCWETAVALAFGSVSAIGCIFARHSTVLQCILLVQLLLRMPL